MSSPGDLHQEGVPEVAAETACWANACAWAGVLRRAAARQLGWARRGQAFTGEAVRSYAGLIDGVVQRYFARWDAGGEFQAYHVCKDLAFDVAACVLLGMQLDVRRP